MVVQIARTSLPLFIRITYSMAFGLLGPPSVRIHDSSQNLIQFAPKEGYQLVPQRTFPCFQHTSEMETDLLLYRTQNDHILWPVWVSSVCGKFPFFHSLCAIFISIPSSQNKAYNSIGYVVGIRLIIHQKNKNKIALRSADSQTSQCTEIGYSAPTFFMWQLPILRIIFVI